MKFILIIFIALCAGCTHAQVGELIGLAPKAIQLMHDYYKDPSKVGKDVGGIVAAMDSSELSFISKFFNSAVTKGTGQLKEAFSAQDDMLNELENQESNSAMANALPEQLLQDAKEDGQALIQIATDITSVASDMIAVIVQLMERNNLIGPDNDKIQINSQVLQRLATDFQRLLSLDQSTTQITNAVISDTQQIQKGIDSLNHNFGFFENPDNQFTTIIQSLQKFNQDVATVTASTGAMYNALVENPKLTQNSGTIVIDLEQAAQMIGAPIANEINSMVDIGTQGGILQSNMQQLDSEMKSV